MSRSLLLFSSALERDAALASDTSTRMAVDTTGVGLVDAAIGTSAAIARFQPESVLYVGTCGAYPDSGLAVGDVVVVDRVLVASGDVARRWMRFPSLLSSGVDADPLLSEALAEHLSRRLDRPVPRACAACTLGVTENDELALLLNRTSPADVENLEAFSVVRAAGALPVAVALGVTNVVGAGGGRAWKEHFTSVLRRLAAAMVDFEPVDRAMISPTDDREER